MLVSFLSGEFLLHVPCWLHFYAGSFSYTFCAVCFVVVVFIWGVSLTHPVLASFLSGESLLHMPCWLHFYLGILFKKITLPVLASFFNLGSFSYTSHAAFVFMWGVSLTLSVLASFFIQEVSLTHLLLASLCGEFFLTHPVLASLVESFSYMYCASFFMWRVSLTHPMLAALCGVFLFHFHASFFMWVASLTHLCWLYTVGSFSYTSPTGFLMWGVSLTCSLKAGGCFMLGFSLTHPMDMLTIPTAYQNKTKRYCGSIFFEKENKQ